MSAELLRRAAKQMRDAATWSQKQYSSPWHDEDNEVLDSRGDTVAEVADLLGVNYLTEHIASWHPAVALAVAEWLDNEAGHCAASEELLHGGAAAVEEAYAFPLAVACAYLGGAS